jgi:hypothetical protein
MLQKVKLFQKVLRCSKKGQNIARNLNFSKNSYDVAKGIKMMQKESQNEKMQKESQNEKLQKLKKELQRCQKSLSAAKRVTTDSTYRTSTQ